MKIAFYKAEYGEWKDKLIAFVTRSKYSHCEIVFEDGMFGSASPRDSGVRMKMIEQNKHWDFFELCNTDQTPISSSQEKIIRLWFVANEDDKYDWIGAIASFFRLDFSKYDKKFCSYVCGLVLLVDPIVTPARLLKVLNQEHMIK